MNTERTSVRKSQNLLMSGFLNSLYYTFPVGMFLTAGNFMFEFVRNYYFSWWIVVLPTVAILLIGNAYEVYLVYQKSKKTDQKKDVIISKSIGYGMAKSKMAGELV